MLILDFSAVFMLYLVKFPQFSRVSGAIIVLPSVRFRCIVAALFVVHCSLSDRFWWFSVGFIDFLTNFCLFLLYFSHFCLFYQCFTWNICFFVLFFMLYHYINVSIIEYDIYPSLDAQICVIASILCWFASGNAQNHPFFSLILWFLWFFGLFLLFSMLFYVSRETY